LLDYPAYTSPVDFEGHKVPQVLLSGNHQKINKFRLEQSIIKTKQNRKDLYIQYKDNEKNEKIK
jgi:tRNA (guanine37-N1)-methyltransferase